MRTFVEDYVERNRAEVEFTSHYFKTTGRHWLHYFNSSSGQPRKPPVLHMWPTGGKVGFIREIQTSELYWLCSDEAVDAKDACRSTSLLKRIDDSNPNPAPSPVPVPAPLPSLSSLFSSLFPNPSSISPPSPLPLLKTMTLQLQTISLTPRAFLIENFISDHESEELIRLATPKIAESVIGQADSGGIFKSTTRTSSNTWIKRSTSPLIETLYRRVANVLGLDQRLLTVSSNAEEIQVVHYNIGEEYQAHYDWGVRGYPESRFITVLLYLSDTDANSGSSSSGTRTGATAGGETAFPKGGFKIIPKRGNAVVFYNLLEDGNGDIDSLHASLPVLSGDKWLANFWVWDPFLTESIRKTQSEQHIN
jgi:prolyl 4-hydroxylase